MIKTIVETSMGRGFLGGAEADKSSGGGAGKFFVLPAILLALALFFPNRASAESPERPRNVLTFDLFNGFRGMGIMEYQRIVSDNFSFTAQGMYWNMEIDTWAVEATGAGVGVRKYTQNTAPEGGFMAANLYIASVSAGTVVFTGRPTDTQTSFYLIPTGTVGYAWIMDEFLMEITIGAQFYAGGIKARYEGDTFPMNGVGFFMTLSAGLPF